ncbi:flavodoxin [Anaerofustis butyriciformans]|uniref:flavodoxin n=1 Tax=Anaerofustis butyriciformans TaxID=3108533 RepID=UPI002E32601C|nr:flavodoxin [Anaerofustis sp. HA2171]
MKNTLVAYFSATGTTKHKAQMIAEALNCDIYEIEPKNPYTSADLNWHDKKSRSSIEMDDKSSIPEIIDNNPNIENYDVVFLGFPIWWYTAPTIINTFLEKYNFENKEVVLFATSGGSGLRGISKDLKGSVSESTIIKEGRMLNGNITKETLESFVKSLNL